MINPALNKYNNELSSSHRQFTSNQKRNYIANNMSNPMLHRVIRHLLLPYYGNTHQLQFLLRPQTRIYRFLIARELLKQYLTLAEARGQEEDFYRAVANEIEEALQHHSPERIASWRRHLRNNGPNPPHLPEFLKTLFSTYYLSLIHI